MEIKQLEKFGQAIISATDYLSEDQSAYYLVSNEEQLVGVGLFQYNCSFCTIAVVKDEHGEVTFLAHFEPGYYVSDRQIKEIYRIFAWAM